MQIIDLSIFTSRGVNVTFALFDATLDPTTRTDSQLEARGLPPPPPSDDAVAHANWAELMSPLPLPLPARTPDVFAAGAVQSTRIANSESSRNWSGAYVPRPGDERRVNWVHAKWTVPAILPQPTKPQAWSTFIGLDGYAANDS